MKLLFIIGVGSLVLGCVPLQKYNDLQENYQKVLKDQTDYKSTAIDYENKIKELDSQLSLAQSAAEKMRKDTLELSQAYKLLEVEYDKVGALNKALEEKYAGLQTKGTAETAKMIRDLEGTRIELQRKEDRLNELEKELNARSLLLDKKESRIKELEEIIAQKDAAVLALKEKIAKALLGYKDKGLTVEERNGRIYVSMEAKLLFASGKIDVGPEGKVALIDLAKVLENQSDIEIVVEGHTDADPLKTSTHPKDNWELSVLRATSVTKIMIENSDMSPTKVMAAGRSEYIPVSDTDKAKNRRIEIIITPNLNALFDLISNKP
ncbi:MAG: OmpA family protein [Putridiphycobacter sp.]|nr:OmpA family protein [Putridiphycobacter sp.]